MAGWPLSCRGCDTSHAQTRQVCSDHISISHHTKLRRSHIVKQLTGRKAPRLSSHQATFEHSKPFNTPSIPFDQKNAHEHQTSLESKPPNHHLSARNKAILTETTNNLPRSNVNLIHPPTPRYSRPSIVCGGPLASQVTRQWRNRDAAVSIQHYVVWRNTLCSLSHTRKSFVSDVPTP